MMTDRVIGITLIDLSLKVDYVLINSFALASSRLELN